MADIGDKQDRNNTIYAVCVMIIICMFAINALVLINVGVRVYKNIAVDNLETFELRTSLSFVATKIRQNDSKGMIHLENKDGTTVLALYEDIDGTLYESVLYHRDGTLYELYHEQGCDYDLTDGLEIMDIASFSFYKTESGCIQLTAVDSQGVSESMFVNVHSGI